MRGGQLNLGATLGWGAVGSKRGCLRGLDSEDDVVGAGPDMKVGS